MINVGDDLYIEKEIRTVVEILKNDSHEDIIRWQSKHNQGACMPSVWQEWLKGISTEDHVRRTI